MSNKLQHKLKIREEEGTLRSLSCYEGMIDFISNDYLGLSHFSLSENYKGATGSRLISGNSKVIEECESNLAELFSASDALCFNSGYDANLGFFSTVPQAGDVVFYDEEIHASVRDGLRLSRARNFAFKHNDINHLEELLVKFKSSDTIFIATEGLFSMNGDVAKVEELLSVAEKFNAILVIDEAHSCGVLGEMGKGLLAQLNDSVVKLVTFGKAYGGHGAVILSSTLIKEYLINFCRTFIYTTALPIESYKRMIEVVQNDCSNNRKLLQKNIEYFRSKINLDLISSEVSPIQIIRGSKDFLKELEGRLKSNNVAAKIIYPPTVKEGEECLRICLHSFNSRKEIDLLISLI